VEELGYGAVWFPEGAMGRESMSNAAVLLANSERLTVGTGISSIWARDGASAANAARCLNESWPGRFVLGLGVSHQPAVAMRNMPGLVYDKPYTAMKNYLQAMGSADEQAGGERPPRLLAALAPKMLQLAKEQADGTHTYFASPEHTAVAREALGPDKTVMVEQGVVLDTDPASARETARAHTSFYLAAPNYRNNMLRLGFDESDCEGGGSDRLVDRIVSWGDVDAVVARVKEHFDAGADHVAVQVLLPGAGFGNPGPFPYEGLERLAPALLEL
jgi:probable F420-dependent oxidoreductase